MSAAGAQLSLGRWADREVRPTGRVRRKARDRRPRRIEAYQAELRLFDVPITRGDCVNGVRPCPWVRCRYHLLVETTDAASLRLHGNEDGFLPHDAGAEDADQWTTHAADRLFELPATCALDVALDEKRVDRTLSVRAVAPYVGLHFSKIATCEADAREKLVQLGRSGDHGIRDALDAWSAVAEIDSRRE